MAVDQTWRTRDRQWLIDQVVDEPGVAYRVWEAEGAPVAQVRSITEPPQLLASLLFDPDELEPVPVQDPWC